MNQLSLEIACNTSSVNFDAIMQSLEKTWQERAEIQKRLNVCKEDNRNKIRDILDKTIAFIG